MSRQTRHHKELEIRKHRTFAGLGRRVTMSKKFLRWNWCCCRGRPVR